MLSAHANATLHCQQAFFCCSTAKARQRIVTAGFELGTTRLRRAPTNAHFGLSTLLVRFGVHLAAALVLPASWLALCADWHRLNKRGL